MRKSIVLLTLTIVFLTVFVNGAKAQPQPLWSLWEWLRNLLFPQAKPVVGGGVITSQFCNYADAFSCIDAGCKWQECLLGSGCTDSCSIFCSCYESFENYCPKLSENDCEFNSYGHCCFARGEPDKCVAKERCSCSNGVCEEVNCGNFLCAISNKCCRYFDINSNTNAYVCYDPKYFVCTVDGVLPCSIDYKFELKGMGTCSIDFTISSNCEGREIEVRDSQGNLKYFGKTPLDKIIRWDVGVGTYNYDVFVDGSKHGSSGDIKCSTGLTTTTPTPKWPHVLMNSPSSVNQGQIFNVIMTYTHDANEIGGIHLRWLDNEFDIVDAGGCEGEVYKNPSFAPGWEGVECSGINSGTTKTFQLKAISSGTKYLYYRAWDLSQDFNCDSFYDYNRDPIEGTCSITCHPDQFPERWEECIAYPRLLTVLSGPTTSTTTSSTTTSTTSTTTTSTIITTTTTSTTTTTTTIPRQFTYSNFNCNQNTKECGMSYTNQVGEPVVVAFYLLRNGELKQSATYLLPEGSGSFTAPAFSCGPLSQGQYIVMFQVFRKSLVPPYKDPILSPIESRSILCP